MSIYFVYAGAVKPSEPLRVGQMIDYHRREGYLVRVDNGVPVAIVECGMPRALFLGALSGLAQ